MTESKGKHAIFLRTDLSQFDIIMLIQFIIKEKMSGIVSFRVVETGSNTFEFLENKQIDLIIIDGLKSGQLNVIQSIHNMYPNTAIFVLPSWDATEDDRRNAKNAGAIGFIDRPFNIDVIIETIEIALDSVEPSQD